MRTMLYDTKVKLNRIVLASLLGLLLAVSGLSACGRTATQLGAAAPSQSHSSVVESNEAARALARKSAAPSPDTTDELTRALARLGIDR